jgi:hypothetical protein
MLSQTEQLSRSRQLALRTSFVAMRNEVTEMSIESLDVLAPFATTLTATFACPTFDRISQAQPVAIDLSYRCYTQTEDFGSDEGLPNRPLNPKQRAIV